MSYLMYDRYDAWRRGVKIVLDQTGQRVADVAKKVDMSRSAIYNLINGSYRNTPKSATLRPVSEALGYSIDELADLGATESNEPQTAAAKAFSEVPLVKVEYIALDAEGNIVTREPRNVAESIIDKVFLDAEGVNIDDVVMFVLKDSSMSPRFPKNTVLLIDTKDVNVQSSHPYLVGWNGELLVRYLDRLPQGGFCLRALYLVEPQEIKSEEVSSLVVYGRAFCSKGPTS